MVDAHADGGFLLKEPSLGFCLGYAAVGELTVLVRSRCDQAPRWKQDEDPNAFEWMKTRREIRLRSVDLGLCLTAEEGSAPFLSECLPQRETLKQTVVFKENGWVMLPARHEFLKDKCLDLLAASFMEVTAADCRDVESSGTHWEEIWHEVPMETQLWLDAE